MRPSAQAGAHELGGVAALLHGHGSHAGEDHGLAVLAAHPHHVAEREHLGMAGQREVGLDRHPAGAVELGARLLGEARGQPGGGDPGGPDHGARRDALGAAAGRLRR